MQNFGWTFCSITDVKLINSPYSESGTNPNYVDISLMPAYMTFNFSITSTYDIEQPKFHNEFCSLGIQSINFVYYGTIADFVPSYILT